MHEKTLNSIYLPLKITFGLVPIVAGLDKFFGFLTDWKAYLSPQIASALPVSPEVMMGVVGIIEIVVGLAILTRFTRLGAYVASAWLVLIAANLILAGVLDVAVRDVVMAIAAFTLGQTAALRGEPLIPETPRREAEVGHAVHG
ncbi:MAG: DoxX family membrane protein [Vicinamibacterales bacterium]